MHLRFTMIKFFYLLYMFFLSKENIINKKKVQKAGGHDPDQQPRIHL